MSSPLAFKLALALSISMLLLRLAVDLLVRPYARGVPIMRSLCGTSLRYAPCFLRVVVTMHTAWQMDMRNTNGTRRMRYLTGKLVSMTRRDWDGRRALLSKMQVAFHVLRVR
jgi:hypothetical protein